MTYTALHVESLIVHVLMHLLLSETISTLSDVWLFGFKEERFLFMSSFTDFYRQYSANLDNFNQSEVWNCGINVCIAERYTFV